VTFSEKVKLYFLGDKLVENNLENVKGNFYTSIANSQAKNHNKERKLVNSRGPYTKKWSKKLTFFFLAFSLLKTHIKIVMVI
jgi:hypothetical protein